MEHAFTVLASAQLLAALVILGSTLRHLQTTQPPKLIDVASQDLPTLSVCIPARDETNDLFECLQSLVASNYPKLEILVLDDNSQDKRTPEIIRQFAHDGVRFLEGKEPNAHWLAKNYAYDQLADEANGDILLFCGVDCRFAPDSLSNLVKTLLQKNKTMISLLPRNVMPNSLKRGLLQPARYAWELALPRRLVNRPPVLSTCWLITREALKAAGTFEAVRRKIVPEAYFARQAVKNDGYSFLLADQSVDVSSVKNFAEQKSTAIRTRYPQLHRRPAIVALVSLAEIAVLLWPLIICGASVFYGQWGLALISGLAYAANAYIYARLVNLTYRRFVPEGFLIFPLAVIYDICILNYSMWQYEFGSVMWKGRNISHPVMTSTAGSARKP
jgi:glycosyltransferase involved in cell wall biosynthesis